MFITVFSSTHSAADQWRAELLEQSWIDSGQSGELVRLVACPADAALPMHGMARVVRTLPYEPHPYLTVPAHGCNLPASLLEWLVTENVEASLLLLDLNSVLLKPFADESEPGSALGHSWRDWPSGKGPFGLAEHYRALRTYCANPDLKPPRIRLPVLVHSSDLRKMAARWLELTGLIHSAARDSSGSAIDAHILAYALAAAEFRIPHRAKKLADVTSDRRSGAAVLDYSLPVESPEGKIVWDPAVYRPWTPPDASEAAPGVGRRFLGYLENYVMLRESGALLATRRPRRRPGVREAHLPDRMLIELPGEATPLQLNASASAIWNLCDNGRTLAEIADVLSQRFDVSRDVLADDIERTVLHLHTRGALDLDLVSQ